MSTTAFFIAFTGFLAEIGRKIGFALLVLIAGRFLVKTLLRMLSRSRLFDKTDGAVKTFTLSFAQAGLYLLLGISVIGILGVPMASIVTALASAGVAIGLALQGALSNMAGGIMLMIFKPFQLGDYVDASGVSGTVREITLFYTILTTPDNKRITIPNGNLMNANVVDYSAEDVRRVDLTFSCAKNEDPARVRDIILDILDANPQILKEPDPPFARLLNNTNEALEFAVRVWCRNENYWNVYFDLTQRIAEALAQAGVQAPAMRVITESR